MPKQFTYSGDPSKSQLDEVRFLIGDTNKDRPLFGDTEILYQIGKTPNSRMSGAELLFVKSNEFATQADIRVGDVSKALSKVSENLKKCGARLREDALRRARPFFGGLTRSGKLDLAARTDDVQPQLPLLITDDPSAVQLNRDIGQLVALGFIP